MQDISDGGRVTPQVEVGPVLAIAPLMHGLPGALPSVPGAATPAPPPEPPRMGVGECPLWHTQEQVLYWVDIPAKTVYRFDPASGIGRSYAMSSEAASLAVCADGGLMVAMRSGFAHLDTATGQETMVAAAPYDTAKIRCNDGRVDSRGRFWIGTIYEPRDAQLAEMLCLERGQLRQVWHGGSTVSNGLAFGLDGHTLMQADTTSHQIRRRSFDPVSGAVGPQEVVREFSMVKDADYKGRPDGAAVDCEGAYWCAMFEGGKLLRMSTSGEVLQEITLPVRCPTMLCFGGPDFKTLYVTSASQNRSAEELAQWPLSGCVLSLRVSVAGRAETAYLA
jgi:sugar lactone lactonase YvrE